MYMADPLCTPQAVADLKAAFKARCKELGIAHQNWRIRVHRAVSWLGQAAAFGDEHAEARFIYLWIALNSLYSRWDRERNAPEPDSQARKRFVDRLLEMDRRGRIGELLRQHRGLVKKLLGNAYLSPVFWRNPEDPKARGRATEDQNYIERNLRNNEYRKLLDQVLERLYVFRGQLVHGASTSGSRLNRTTLKYCLTMLDRFAPAIVEIVAESGCNDDWPELCYPPVG